MLQKEGSLYLTQLKQGNRIREKENGDITNTNSELFDYCEPSLLSSNR